MLVNVITVAISLLFASNTLALPIPAPLPAGTEGTSCSEEGKFVCVTDFSFQQCGSGTWTREISLGWTTGQGPLCKEVFGLSAPAVQPVQQKQESKPEPPAVSTPPPPPPPPPPAPPATTPSPPPVSTPPTQTNHQTQKLGTMQTYSGPSSSFPDPSTWLDFDTLWTMNLPALKINDSPEEITFMKSAIQQVSGSSHVDARVILAVIMQESAGNVRVPTTNNGVVNPGIMQSHNGVSFNPADPEGSILQMVKDGVEGTSSGDGIVQLLGKTNGDVWRAVRAYNSGSVDTANLSNGLGSTSSYCSDVANRLTGAKLSA